MGLFPANCMQFFNVRLFSLNHLFNLTNASPNTFQTDVIRAFYIISKGRDRLGRRIDTFKRTGKNARYRNINTIGKQSSRI